MSLSLAAVMLIGGVAFAANDEWVGTDQANSLWTDANNWLGVVPTNTSNTGRININNEKDATTLLNLLIDVNGADLNLPDRNVWMSYSEFVDSSAGTPTFNVKSFEIWKPWELDGSVAELNVTATDYFNFGMSNQVTQNTFVGMTGDITVTNGYAKMYLGGNDSPYTGTMTATGDITMTQIKLAAGTIVTAGGTLTITNADLSEASTLTGTGHASLQFNGTSTGLGASVNADSMYLDPGAGDWTISGDLTATGEVRVAAYHANKTLTLGSAITADTLTNAAARGDDDTSSGQAQGGNAHIIQDSNSVINVNKIHMRALMTTNISGTWYERDQLAIPYMKVTEPITLNTGVHDVDIQIDSARYLADHAGALGGSTAVVAADNKGQIEIGTQQTTFPEVRLTGTSTLYGNLTGADYTGAGKNVFLEEGSIVVDTVGTGPSQADLIAEGVKIYKPVTDISASGSTSYDSSSEQYMGLAIDTLWSTATMNTSMDVKGDLIATAAGEDLNIYAHDSQATGSSYNYYYQAYNDGLYQSDTQVANIKLGPNTGFHFTEASINGNDNTGTNVNVFNVIYHPESRGIRIDFANKPNAIDSNQTWTFRGGMTWNINADAIKGRAEFNQVMVQRFNADLVAGPNTHLAFNEGSALALSSSQLTRLDGLTTGQVSSDGTSIVYLLDGGTFDLSAASHPALMAVLAKSDLALETGTNILTGDGYTFSDGRVMMNSFNYNTTLDATSLVFVDPAASNIHFIGTSGQKFTINALIDVENANVVIGDSVTRHGVYNDLVRDIAPADMREVLLKGELTSNSGTVNIIVKAGAVGLGGTVDDAAGTTAVNVLVKSGGSFQAKMANQTPLDLSKTNITVEAGGAALLGINSGTANYNNVHGSGDVVSGGAGIHIAYGNSTTVARINGRLSGDMQIGNINRNDMTLGATGTIAPGDQPGDAGTIEWGVGGLSDVNFEAGATYEWDLVTAGGVAGTDYDTIVDDDTLKRSGTRFDGAWTLEIVAGDTLDAGDIVVGDTFELFSGYGSASKFENFSLGNVTFVLPDGWFAAAGNVDPTISTVGGTLVLTGLVSAASDIPGDANGSGFVDDDDLAVLLSNWEQDAGTITVWALGDFTGDTDVDDDDLAVLLGNWTGPPPGGAAVPEPATLALLGLGGLSVLRRRRK